MKPDGQPPHGVGGQQCPETLDAQPRALSAETRRLYAGDWTRFVAWCRTQSCASLPAVPATVAAYLQSRGDGLGHGALNRNLAAIAEQHLRHGHCVPAADPVVRSMLQAARVATPRRPKQPTPSQLSAMAAACPGDLAGLRDRALLLLTASGVGRGDLVGLDAEHIRFTEPGLTITLGNRDADVVGRTLLVGRGAMPQVCPARAMEDWLQASQTAFGPVFRKINRWGSVEHRRLGPDAVRRILIHRALRRRARAKVIAR